ncbi:MAG: MFS transporter [Myxococcota bacterium]
MDSSPKTVVSGSGEHTRLPSFLLGAGSWFAAFGMHSVLFSTLLVVGLGEDEVRVGAAQSAMMVPATVLVLFGGVIADRRDRRRLLMQLHGIAGVLALALAAAVSAGALSYPLLIGYALCMGSIQAFLMPARDAMLSEAARGDLGRAVAKLNTTQWGSQALGALAGSLTRFAGAPAMLVAQSMVVVLGVPAWSRLPPAPPRRDPRARLTLRDLTSGAGEVWKSPVLLPSLVLVSAVGVLFIGPFMVVFPLMVRDVYGGGVSEIALVSTAFPVDTIVGSSWVIMRGGVRRKGRAQLVSLAAGSLILLVIAQGLPFWGTLLAVSCWGMVAAIFMIAGRTLFQERASEANRARVLSTYTLGFMGAAGLFGAPLSGLLVGRFGSEAALAVIAASMLAVVATVAVATGIAQVD